MKCEVKSIEIVCDGCGEVFHDGDDFCCYVGDEDGEMIQSSAFDSDWWCVGDKDYCPNCYHIDDEDHVVCKDGRVYDYDSEELLEGGEK